LIISHIVNIYSHTVEEDAESTAKAEHSLLIIKRKGRSIYTVNQAQLVADPDHILYLPVGTDYDLYVDREGPCCVIEFDTSDQKNDGAPCAFYIGNDEEIAASLKTILYYWNLRGPAYHSKCLSEIYNLLTQISNIQSYAYSLAGKYQLIHRSINYIERNYANPDLYTPMLAKMSGIGETYYRNIFLSVFGVPPTRYIQQYRIEKAKERLVSTSNSVDEIAVAVGFSNASYFCKVFKSLTGMTPSEFAERGKRIG
jgi:AraC-like DNA-binding protein